MGGPPKATPERVTNRPSGISADPPKIRFGDTKLTKVPQMVLEDETTGAQQKSHLTSSLNSIFSSAQSVRLVASTRASFTSRAFGRNVSIHRFREQSDMDPVCSSSGLRRPGSHLQSGALPCFWRVSGSLPLGAREYRPLVACGRLTPHGNRSVLFRPGSVGKWRLRRSLRYKSPEGGSLNARLGFGKLRMLS